LCIEEFGYSVVWCIVRVSINRTLHFPSGRYIDRCFYIEIDIAIFNVIYSFESVRQMRVSLIVG